MSETTDIVIVGAGPIGLVYAICIKKLNPALEVVVIEKYEEYQRKHTLIIEPNKLDALMLVAEIADIESLCTLLTSLRKNPNIRTNKLESVFKKLAMDLDVQIKIEEIKEASIQNQILQRYPNASLIIGADGTHSIVSQSLFPEGNQVKHEFDYALQLRYEIQGDITGDAIDTFSFLQDMAQYGLIANEYVGEHIDGTTPVTMQLLISREHFETLKGKATSKNPIFLCRDNQTTSGSNTPLIPKEIDEFLTHYFFKKIKTCQERNNLIVKDSIRISVNELPATHARQIVRETTTEAPVLLVGDASLGLSYFKGLNAGFEAATVFFSTLGPIIKDGFTVKAVLLNGLNQYQSWFLNDFSPKKVKEVAQYSRWRIQLPMKAATLMAEFLSSSIVKPIDGSQSAILHDFFNLLEQTHLEGELINNKRNIYPHRPYFINRPDIFDDIPTAYTMDRIKKDFIDYVKPYKSSAQAAQNFIQPFQGIGHTTVGLIKMLIGIFTADLSYFANATCLVLRGLIEITTTPFAWIIKPITRGIATLVYGKPNIEENAGIQKIAALGAKLLDETTDFPPSSPQKMYDIFSICGDLHRKFDKSCQRGQATLIELEELTRFNALKALKAQPELTKAVFTHYISLFTSRNVEQTPISYVPEPVSMPLPGF